MIEGKLTRISCSFENEDTFCTIGIELSDSLSVIETL